MQTHIFRRHHRRRRRRRHACRHRGEPRAKTAVTDQALPHTLPHRRSAGRHVRSPRQRRGRQLGVAHLRHRQGRRLPRRPGRRRDHVQGGHRRCLDLEKMGLPFNRHAEAKSTSAGSVVTPQTTARLRPPLLLRRRPHRPHDPADPLPELRQARRRVLQRVLRPRLSCLTRDARRNPSPLARSPTSSATGEIHIFRAKSVVFATGGFGKVCKTTSNAHTLTGDGMGICLAQGHPAGGHGVLTNSIPRASPAWSPL